MLKTRICELFGIDYPIVLGGMGSVSLAQLAAAVSEAGGLGTIALGGFSPEAIHNEIGAARRLTKKPLAVNLLLPFLRPGVIEALVEEPIQAITFAWGDPAEHILRAKKNGIKIIFQCGSIDDALAAKRAGADVIIAQGFEAGGHVHGEVTTLALVPEMRDVIGDTPMLAAGGIADGRGLVAALALGADGALFGTRFLASDESAARPIYKERIVKGRASETLYTTLFDVGWKGAPHRVLRSAAVEEWERAGRPESGKRPSEGQVIGKLTRGGTQMQLMKYSVLSPSSFTEGDFESMPFYAGQSCSMVHDILPAGDIVRRIVREAQEVIEARLASLVR
jgi:nitronate monooxygenase